MVTSWPRLDGAESRLLSVGELEESVSALAAELKRRPDGDALADAVAGLRAELEVLADRPTIADPDERLLELSRRIDRTARDGHDRIGGLAEELSLRIGGLAKELGHQVDDLASRADGFVGRDEAAAVAAEQATWVRAELEALRALADERAAAVDVALAEAANARAAGQQELVHRLDDAVGAISIDLEARASGLGSQLQEQRNETTALRVQVEELQEAATDRASFEARLESMLEQRLEGLAGRITDEVAGARAEAAEGTAAVRGESASLGARLDEMLSLRHTDARTAREASEQLAERVEALAARHADDADAARATASELAERLTSLVGSLHAEAADARAAADGLEAHVAAQIGDLSSRYADDLAAAELAGAELAARLDDHALRSAAAAFEVEQELRDELGGVAARLEEQDARGIEAREELRGELERVSSSVGWRLERIEESLASDDTEELKSALVEVERRLEGQVALGEEQVRQTERALRKGLASLGERLVSSESAYVEAGKTLRRSIERLGAAVVEADARMADQIPVAEVEGCVAFAPTAAGYRLVELPGKPPEVGSTVELEGCDGPLVVTRYGRSPLPLDNRSCAYLDRA
jgi:colicin import membrane protein